MRLVFAAIPAYGHLYPLMPLAMACAEAGHDVRIATGPPFLDRLPLPTVVGVDPTATLAGVEAETRRRHPTVSGLDMMVAMFADTTADITMQAFLPMLRDVRPDLVVYEAMNVGAAIAANLAVIPAVAFSIALTSIGADIIAEAAVQQHADRWTDLGRNVPDSGANLSVALLDPVPPALKGPPDVAAPGAPAPPVATVRRVPIRTVPFSEHPDQVPAWLTAAATRPRVFATLGTVAFGAVDVLRRVVEELQSIDVDVLVAVGPRGDPDILGSVTHLVHVERFVPQGQILPLIDVAVHHGGTGTVLGVMAAGRPQLILPQGADQFFNAEIASAVGAARALRADHRPGQIAEAVSAMLGPSPERATAAHIRGEIEALPSPADVVPTLMAIAGG